MKKNEKPFNSGEISELMADWIFLTDPDCTQLHCELKSENEREQTTRVQKASV